jgi:hypothetical protein
MTESPDSVELVYTAPGTDALSARWLVRSFAERQNVVAGEGEGSRFGDVSVAPPAAGAVPGTATILPGTRASVDEVQGGAVLRLAAPVTPSEKRLLRESLREGASRGATCPPVTTPPPSVTGTGAAGGAGRY